MDRLPAGWVTFVFTDIEGSTRLFQRLGDRFRPLLEQHRRLLRAVWEQHEGVEVGTKGDSFFVAFASPGSALAACVDGQLALLAHPWPDGGSIRVRMGVHSGEAEPIEGDYVALAVHQAARVSATGHGGQVIVSDATRACTEGAVPDDISLVPLGSYRLKDFDDPQRLFQLCHPGLVAEFPALKALPATGHNLPLAQTRFIGRDADVTAVAALVASIPLVTLTGPGGVGKTRLALEVASGLVDGFGDGVWLVELGAVVDPPSVASVVASTLGIREEPGRPVTVSLLDALRGWGTLIVLDNCEHLLEACGELVDTMLNGLSTLAVLATSREPLGVASERIWSVAPMNETDAQRLFVDRAGAVRRDFALTDREMATVATICVSLDGLPLAVELAAARVSAFTPAQILSKLEKRLPLLAGGRRGTPDRQRTLGGAIDWSYRLLSREEQELFCSLSVFRGGCSLDAAETVAGADVDYLQSLVEKSLLTSADSRFSMLETVRQFAAERVNDQAGMAEELQRLHAEYYAAAAPDLGWRARESDVEALDTLDAEYDNACAAFDWGLAHQRFDICERFVEGLWYHWVRSGLTNHGYRLASAALDRSSSPSAQMLSLTAELARFSGDLERATQLKRDSLSAFTSAGAPTTRIAADHTDLAETLIELGQLEEAERHAKEGLALRQEVGEAYGIAHAQAVLVQLELARGNGTLAASIAEQSMPIFHAARAWSDLAWAEVRTATAYVRTGDHQRGRHQLREAFRHGIDIAESAVIVAAIEQTAGLAARTGDDETALRLFGAAQAGRSATGWAIGRDESALSISSSRVEAARRDALVAEGRTWHIDEASRRALEFLTTSPDVNLQA